MNFKHTKPVVLVTGSSRGIGAATARIFSKKGYDVVINFKSNEKKALDLNEELESHDTQTLVVQADISKERDLLRMFDRVDSVFGKLDVLVNNAGILMRQSRLDEIGSGRIRKVLMTNVLGYFLCCREAVKRMSTKYGGTGGSIVNVSSVAAGIGSPNEYIDYAASKGAVDTLTKGLALEVAGEGIRVNCVRPGIIYTDIHKTGGEPGRVDRLKSSLPLKRGGMPEEVAAAIYWLASDHSSYSTGVLLDVAGGR